MVFAHVCQKKRSVPTSLMGNLVVVCHRQVVFKRDQENPVKAAQRKFAARRPEMKLDNSTKYHSAANGMVANAVQGVFSMTRVGQHQAKDGAEHASDDMDSEPRGNHHPQIVCGSGWQDTDYRWRRRTGRPQTEMTEFGEKVVFRAHDEMQQMEQSRREVAVRAVHGSSNEIMMGGPDGNVKHGHSGGCQKTKCGM